MAAAVLAGFRDLFPGHALQPEVTKKIAYVYREDGQLALAADEYERVERESPDDEVRREALLIAADLHEQAGNSDRALEVYRRYVGYFPHPVEPNLETRNKIAEALKKKNDQDTYLAELKQIVVIDAGAGGERTPRTRYLAGKAALVLAEQTFDHFAGVKLVEPFEANLRKKKELMKVATQQFNKLPDYEVGEVTAAATFYLAEIYANFSNDLKESERPTGLNALEREEYELAIEEQAYPFEEKAIAMHKSNLELISLGVYNEWIDKSLQKLAKFVPARYDKPEEESAVIASLDSYQFAIERPEPPAPQAGEAKQDAKPAEAQEATKAEEPALGVDDRGGQAAAPAVVVE
jgi:tetratricopeptide (TPR) repeat protein